MVTNRAGRTVITSISITKEFDDLIKRHGISPTWAFRKGVAIELFEKGVQDYDSPLNRSRHEAIKDLIDDEKIEKLINIIEELNKIGESIDWFRRLTKDDIPKTM